MKHISKFILEELFLSYIFCWFLFIPLGTRSWSDLRKCLVAIVLSSAQVLINHQMPFSFLPLLKGFIIVSKLSHVLSLVDAPCCRFLEWSIWLIPSSSSSSLCYLPLWGSTYIIYQLFSEMKAGFICLYKQLYFIIRHFIYFEIPERKCRSRMRRLR